MRAMRAKRGLPPAHTFLWPAPLTGFPYAVPEALVNAVVRYCCCILALLAPEFVCACVCGGGRQGRSVNAKCRKAPLTLPATGGTAVGTGGDVAGLRLTCGAASSLPPSLQPMHISCVWVVRAAGCVYCVGGGCVVAERAPHVPIWPIRPTGM